MTSLFTQKISATSQVPPWHRTPEHIDPHRFSIPSPLVQPQPRNTFSFPTFPSPAQTTTQPLPKIASPVSQAQTPITKLLLLIALTYKQGHISNDEKGKLKDLSLSSNHLVLSALEVFEIDQDLPELVDTLKRICRIA